ncbi:MAG: class I SAM-dependent methyltransferase [Saprospiraceae bacterium]|nr:class I SAM-dependent methyltransferase [Saprospiraceae bacterium]
MWFLRKEILRLTAVKDGFHKEENLGDKVVRYLKFYWAADTVFNVHSPFVYEFVTDVFDVRKQYYAFNHLEYERRILLSNSSTIEVQDFGAGSKTARAAQRSIASIARRVVSSPAKCRMLFNLVNKFRPQTLIELGTSLGLSALYMAMANGTTQIYTIEADPAIHKLARLLFEKNHTQNIHAFRGTFEEQLPSLFKKVERVDAAYIDGNHTYDATMVHFEMLLPCCHADSILIFDDIYWSDGMSKAWEEIKQRPEVALTIDTFDLGFVFFNMAFEKQHVKLIDYYKKPWRIGLFG